MAVDMFLKCDDLPGESVDSVHKGTMDILAWSWGISQSGSTHSGSGSGTGKANFQDLSFTTYVDKSTPTLMYAVSSGKHMAKATLICRKAGDKPLEYIKIVLEDFIVSSYSTGGSGGEDRLTANFTLNFAKVTVNYAAQDKTGKKSDGADYMWDVSANVKM